MKFAVLASGSKANCTYVAAGGISLLIDCGLSAREAERRLRVLGLDPAGLAAILVTHEHSDHIRGLSLLSRRYALPVYANRATAAALDLVHDLIEFESNRTFALGPFGIHPFSVTHDAADPVGFSLSAEGCKLAYAADLGRVTNLVRQAMLGSQAVILESNHDLELLRDSRYPWALKQRIASTHGHLDNWGAAELTAELCHSALQYVVLAHLSENSNTPQQALAAFSAKLPPEAPQVLCASAAAPTPLLEIFAEQLAAVG